MLDTLDTSWRRWYFHLFCRLISVINITSNAHELFSGCETGQARLGHSVKMHIRMLCVTAWHLPRTRRQYCGLVPGTSWQRCNWLRRVQATAAAACQLHPLHVNSMKSLLMYHDFCVIMSTSERSGMFAHLACAILADSGTISCQLCTLLDDCSALLFAVSLATIKNFPMTDTLWDQSHSYQASTSVDCKLHSQVVNKHIMWKDSLLPILKIMYRRQCVYCVLDKCRRSSSVPLLGVPFRRTSFARRSLSTAAPLTWNSLPPAVLNCDCLSIFKSRLKTHLFSTAFC